MSNTQSEQASLGPSTTLKAWAVNTLIAIGLCFLDAQVELPFGVWPHSNAHGPRRSYLRDFSEMPFSALPWAPLACGPGGTVPHPRSSPYCPIGSFPRTASLPPYWWPPMNVCEGELNWESIFSFSLGLSSSVDNDKSSAILTLHIPPGLKSGHWGRETRCCVSSDNVNLLAKGFENRDFPIYLCLLEFVPFPKS